MSTRSHKRIHFTPSPAASSLYSSRKKKRKRKRASEASSQNEDEPKRPPKKKRTEFQTHKVNDKWRKYFLLGMFTFSENCFYILSMPPLSLFSLNFISASTPMEQRRQAEKSDDDARKLYHPENKTPQQKLRGRYLSRCFFALLHHSSTLFRCMWVLTVCD